MRADLPSETQVRAAMTALLTDAAAGGARPTVTALARRVGVSRPGLYRNFRPLVDELLQTTTSRPEPDRPRRHQATRDLEDTLARLRRRCDEQERHLRIYAEVIRQLTVDNTRLRSQLEQRVGVVDLTARRHDSPT
jgi:AcrR family transcriptional regulator